MLYKMSVQWNKEKKTKHSTSQIKGNNEIGRTLFLHTFHIKQNQNTKTKTKTNIETHTHTHSLIWIEIDNEIAKGEHIEPDHRYWRCEWFFLSNNRIYIHANQSTPLATFTKKKKNIYIFWKLKQTINVYYLKWVRVCVHATKEKVNWEKNRKKIRRFKVEWVEIATEISS